MSDPLWYIPVYDWLVRNAIVSSVVLVIACVVLGCLRQATRRIRLIEITMVACLLLPWLPMIPGYPVWSVDWLASASESITPPTTFASESASQSLLTASISNADADSLEPDVEPDQAATTASLAPIDNVDNFDVRLWIVIAFFAGIALTTTWWLLGIAALDENDCCGPASVPRSIGGACPST